MEALITRLMPDLLALFLLIILFTIVHRNYYFSGKREEVYYKTILITIFTVVLEIATVCLQDSPCIKLRPLNILCNTIGFIISPFVCFGLALTYNTNYARYRYILAIPLYIHTVIAALSGWTGWVFYIGLDNSYQRGPLFFVNTIVSVYSFVLLVIALSKQYRKYERAEKLYLLMLYLIILVGNIIQLTFPNALAIWSSVAVSLVLYYVFMRELQTKYDALTGSHNRYSFYKGLDELRRKKKAVIVFLDLNNLKKVNDTRGHKYGDLYLKEAATLFETCFTKIGTVYRIGGDEFCILCENSSDDDLQPYYAKLKEEIEKLREKNETFSIAYGSAEWTKESGEALSAAVEKADQRMYENKRAYKKSSCRKK